MNIDICIINLDELRKKIDENNCQKIILIKKMPMNIGIHVCLNFRRILFLVKAPKELKA